MAKRRGPGQKTTRPPRLSNVPRADDEQTEVEIRLDAGGAKRNVPPSKEIGAGKRSAASRASGQRRDSRPVGGSDVAPTARAAAREKARHRLERKVGRQAAGVAVRGNQRKGSSRASRSAVDQAARQADRMIAGDDVPTRTTTPRRRGSGARQTRR